MSYPSWQWHRTESSWSPVRTLPVAPLWCDLGFFPNSSDNKAAANLRPTGQGKGLFSLRSSDRKATPNEFVLTVKTVVLDRDIVV